MLHSWNLPGASVCVAAIVLVACGDGDPELRPAIESITVDDLASHIQILASDSFEGRAPSSPGEDKTIRYLQTKFEEYGLEPGNDGSFFQNVPLVAITADPNATLQIRGGGSTSRFRYGPEFMAWTLRMVERADLDNSQLVFVGYGIVAPEYGWDDYADVDVRGKTVVMLVNDPGFATEDTTLFNGRAMTYYGRWTYKFEEAARQGAAGAFIVHETEPAAYPWEVVENGWSGPQFGLVAGDDNMSRAEVEGWMTLETARTVFRQAGLDYDGIKQQAASKGFKPVPMSLTASVTLRNTLERSASRNVLALLRGTDRADEYVVYMAHWDHLGRDSGLEGDQIYNGALDNATGTAGLLELAQAFASLDSRPSRSVLFLAVAAEEQGLLGSLHYATNPVYPLAKTVAAINIDGLNIWGPMRDITVVGYGNSELDDYLAAAAQTQDRVLRPDPEPEKGFYYRSDHFSFAKQGVPALYADAGLDHVEYGEEWSLERRDEYTAANYHRPSDEYDPSWDLSGGVDDLRLLLRVGYRLADESSFPNWRTGTEFRALRDSMMADSR
jgi:Zn-dependent M28 family amino/carboxypeptidase